MKTRLKIFTTILSVLAFCAFLPTMQAQLPLEIPGNPDGCYPAFTTAEGCNALHQLFGGLGNTRSWLVFALLAGDASFNTGVGAGTLALTSRTGVGTDGNSNTAVGTAAMILNLSGDNDTAVGTNALVNNMIASGNTGVGSFVLYNNDSSGAGSATLNTAVGDGALFDNVDGAGNTAVGSAALSFNRWTASLPSVRGARFRTPPASGTPRLVRWRSRITIAAITTPPSAAFALTNNDSTGTGAANFNTAVGSEALEGNVDGSDNTAVGFQAGANYTGMESGNISVGSGVSGVVGENNTIRIGDNLPTVAGHRPVLSVESCLTIYPRPLAIPS